MMLRRSSISSFCSQLLKSSYSHNLNYARSSSSSSLSSSSNPHLITSSATALHVSSKATTDFASLSRHYGRCYWELSKARLSMLVVATSGTGFVLGRGSAVDFSALSWTCLGTMMVAASANSLNQVFEINNDAKMKRTSRRPLPSGRITKPHAIGWASSVGLAGTALLATQTNMLAAGLAASNLVLYAFVYTPLKQIHHVNTWVGAVVGAIPPLLGWAAASNDISLNAMILPAALYFWQIPHFMALAYMCRSD
ncbi:protoheme IX farnesyltransferase, mitochondrial-like [Vigna umbellata]|uniref:protoheme IX farnesyltransferase, mitochondrial-like n=1 Tax=Vigna umbellata TaxID=87088 RepID=UPI001F5EE6AE|nr:protoheme IX farnesyltransferase, mitochondrial-like [Vigna umbellata]